MVLENRAFERYIALNHDSWYRFAESLGHAVEPEDIVLVSGWLKTSAWALAVCTNHGRAHEVLFNAQLGSVAGTKFDVKLSQDVEMSVDQRSGPSQKNLQENGKPTRDQCIFLRYYKLKKRPFWGRKIVASSEPTEDHKDDDDGDTVWDSRTVVSETETLVPTELDKYADGLKFDTEVLVNAEPAKLTFQVSLNL